MAELTPSSKAPHKESADTAGPTTEQLGLSGTIGPETDLQGLVEEIKVAEAVEPPTEDEIKYAQYLIDNGIDLLYEGALYRFDNAAELARFKKSVSKSNSD